MRVSLTIDVEIHDENKLQEYVRDNLDEWGMSMDETIELPEAVYETIVLNAIRGGPLAVGLEIVNHHAEPM
ncbi:hypothetical protein AYO40_05550 [Planctomycetaceae bacterium SCGC AG-212-D15]|nr:hypothetical protein AYO40_05550 [Planctomycetaceae bacterium SCGC AG-212-D15]